MGSWAQTTITLTDLVVTVSSYTNSSVVINGKTDLHLTASSKPLNSSTISLNSADSWVFIDNIRPQVVIDSLLKYIYVNNQPAVLKTNVRVSIYKQGAVIIPQSSSYQPLTVYAGQNFTASSQQYSLFTFNNSLGAFDNKIRSFKLKRGYMATLATVADGTGYSRVYIADNSDIEVPVLPSLLDNMISFIRVVNWEWVSKKGLCGSDNSTANALRATWRYNWNASDALDNSLEYVPMRCKLNWPGFSSINARQYVSHVLGLNEPDHPEQHKDDNGGNAVTIVQALAQWPDMLRTGLRVGAPSCTNTSWIYQFIDSCKARNYRVDYVGWHAYWGGKSASSWYNDLKAIHNRTGLPIWITEWNNGANWTTESWPNDPSTITDANATKQLNDLKGILNVLDTAHFVERYSIYNWVEDARAMFITVDSSFMARNPSYASYTWLKTAPVIAQNSGKLLNGTTGIVNVVLTPAGQYYTANNSAIAFNRVNEVIPGWGTFSTPSLNMLFTGNNTGQLSMIDGNGEFNRGYSLERQYDGGNFNIVQSSSSAFSYKDVVDVSMPYSKVRYRVRTLLPDSTYTSYSNVTGYDITNGAALQYGYLSYGEAAWKHVLFRQAYSAVPVIMFGSPSFNNVTLMNSDRAKQINSARFVFQFDPWSYQNVTTFSQEEKIPYFILDAGNYNFGGLSATANKATVNPAWTQVNFSTPFDTIPVVFATIVSSTTTTPTSVRVRNITKTGFEAKIQKESKVTTAPSAETVSYFAITPGTGLIDNKKVVVGRSATDNIKTTAYTTISYGDSIPSPYFYAQLQTCNDDTVTATLGCRLVGNTSATLIKEREKSLGITVAATEKAGWMVLSSVNSNTQGVNTTALKNMSVYPNPAKEVLFLTQSLQEPTLVDVYSVFGALVKSLMISSNEINISDLSSGCYILKIGGIKPLKFLKQ